jgi:hypothetical protein
MACHCANGWVCEAHPDQPYEHLTPDSYRTFDGRELAYKTLCGGAGMHYMNPECEYGRENLKRKEIDDRIDREWYPNGFPQAGDR